MEYHIIDPNYTKGGIEAISKSSLLGKDNLSVLQEISAGLMEAWENDKIWRSEVEMRFSVLNDTKFPTKGSKYLQARHEQETHFRNLMYLSADYEEKQGELMVLQAELEDLEEENPDTKNMGKIRIKKAQIRRCLWALEEMKKAGHHRVREVSTWEKIKQELNDGSFDPNDYDGIQAKAYNLRWRQELENETRSGQASGNRIGVLEGSLSALSKSHAIQNTRK